MLGEETVLIKALEGKRGQPDQRPPYPTETRPVRPAHRRQQRPDAGRGPVDRAQRRRRLRDHRVHGEPGHRPRAAPRPRGRRHRRGPAGHARFASSCALAGGTGSRPLKAVLVGGPTGGLLPRGPARHPVRVRGPREAGAHIGSGSVVIADDRACVVDLARLLTKFSADAACGKSIPCRIGLRRLYEIGDRVASGRPTPDRRRRCWGTSPHDIAASALCDHERLATLPFTSAMRYFRSEIDDHLLRSTCPAGVCTPISGRCRRDRSRTR